MAYLWPPSLTAACPPHCKRAHLAVKKGLQELRIGKKKRGRSGSTRHKAKVCVCNVRVVVCWIIHASALQLEIEGGKNKMFKTHLDDFSGGAV